MEEFWIIILVLFFGTNSLDKAESVQFEELEELPLQTFDELFVDEWWDNEKDEEWNKLTLEQNVLHQIDRQNTQIGQIEPNSTDRNSLTESDHSDNAKNGGEQNEIIKEITSNEKLKIIDKFHAIKNEFKQKGKFSDKERLQIEENIAKHLKVNRTKIYKWKKEFGLSQKRHNFGKEKNERKNLVEKFDQMKAELTRAGFKSSYKNEINEIVAKELGLSFLTIYNWKRKLGQTKPQHMHSQSEQKELIKLYYEIKEQNPKIKDEDIAKRLNISRFTLCKWKKQFKPEQFYQNSVDEHSRHGYFVGDPHYKLSFFKEMN